MGTSSHGAVVPSGRFAFAGGPKALGVSGWRKEGRTASQDRWPQDCGMSAPLSLRADKPRLLSLSPTLSRCCSSPGFPGLLTPVPSDPLIFFRSELLVLPRCQQPMTSLCLYDAGAGQAANSGNHSMSLEPQASSDPDPFSHQEGLPACSATPCTGAFSAAFLGPGLRSPGSWTSQPTAANSRHHKPDSLAPGGPGIPP